MLASDARGRQAPLLRARILSLGKRRGDVIDVEMTSAFEPLCVHLAKRGNRARRRLLAFVDPSDQRLQQGRVLRRAEVAVLGLPGEALDEAIEPAGAGHAFAV